MVRGWQVWVVRAAVLPCPLFLLTACTPPATLPGPPVDTSPAFEGASPNLAFSGRYYAVGQMLAREQQRSAALQQQLDQRGREVEELRGEVRQLRERESELRAALDRVPGTQGTAAATAVAAAAPVQPVPDAAAPAPVPPGGEAGATEAPTPAPPAATTGPVPEPAAVAALRTELVQEQERRQAAETELQRLKEETSTPPYQDDASADAGELAAARDEINDLHQALDDERAKRDRLAEEFRALQARADEAAQAATVDQASQARLAELEAEKRALEESFNRSLAASQQRANELERELATTRAAVRVPALATDGTGTDGGGDAGLAVVRAENSALRARLDEEHRRTEQLAAKLRVATRVADLIFKMQAQRVTAQQLPE